MSSTRLVGSAGLVAAVVCGLASQSPAAPAHSAPTSPDGPGSYVVVRTFPQTAAPTPEQDAACDAHFGPVRSATVALRQAAVEFVPEVQPVTGLAVDEAASYVGNGYICAAPGVNEDLTEAFATAELPAGDATMHGQCRVSARGLVKLAPFLGCRLTVDPVPGVAQGGHAITNSVAGSLVVAYLVRDPDEPLPYTPPQPEPGWRTLPNDPDFYLWRDHSSTVAATCTTEDGGRSALLSATQPNPQTAVLADASVSQAGEVTLCFGDGDNAVARISFVRGGRTTDLTARGDCREEPTLAGPDLLAQTCVLDVVRGGTPLFRAGQVTSIGLVRADDPRAAANSHIWTLGILDSEAGTLP